MISNSNVLWTRSTDCFRDGLPPCKCQIVGLMLNVNGYLLHQFTCIACVAHTVADIEESPTGPTVDKSSVLLWVHPGSGRLGSTQGFKHRKIKILWVSSLWHSADCSVQIMWLCFCWYVPAKAGWWWVSGLLSRWRGSLRRCVPHCCVH